MLGGFCQGATIALGAYLTYAEGILGGVACLGGFNGVAVWDWDSIVVDDLKKTPVLFYHGLDDDVIPEAYAKTTYE